MTVKTSALALLLGLLQKYGYAFRIDLAEAKKLNSAI
jgi:hypothetical protein